MNANQRPYMVNPDHEEDVDPDLICNNCGHDSPHVQQDGDACWCNCVEYDCDRYPATKGSQP